MAKLGSGGTTGGGGLYGDGTGPGEIQERSRSLGDEEPWTISMVMGLRMGLSDDLYA